MAFNGRYPNRSAWMTRLSGRFDKATQLMNYNSFPEDDGFWKEFFFANDNIFNNRVQRWDGTRWVRTDIKLYKFQ